MPHMNVAIPKPPEPVVRLLGECLMAFDRVNLSRNPTENRRRVTRAGADVENAVTGLYVGRFCHESDNIGLRNRLTFGDREGRVLIGELFQLG